MFFGFAKQTKKQAKQVEFGLFRFEPKIKFDCFEDTRIKSVEHRDTVRWSIN
jgi:hypothetical protein